MNQILEALDRQPWPAEFVEAVKKPATVPEIPPDNQRQIRMVERKARTDKHLRGIRS